MSAGLILRALMRPLSPFDEELERLADQRARKIMTEREYRALKAEVETARQQAAVR